MRLSVGVPSIGVLLREEATRNSGRKSNGITPSATESNLEGGRCAGQVEAAFGIGIRVAKIRF